MKARVRCVKESSVATQRALCIISMDKILKREEAEAASDDGAAES
jgi:hypothetical protein|nr:MAG TPA: hypothetical protein [Caudoviricetes sp.]